MSIPNAWGLTYQEVMGLCWLSYKGNGGGDKEGLWMIDGKQWQIGSVELSGGFAAIMATGNGQRVASFSGTDDGIDWADNVSQGLLGVSSQYVKAIKYAKTHDPQIVVGHSLGGGLASYCANYQGRYAATINAAPLNINPISIFGMFKNHKKVVNYMVPGEVLHLLDVAMINMKKIGVVHKVTSTGKNPIAKHLIPNLVGFVAPTRI